MAFSLPDSASGSGSASGRGSASASASASAGAAPGIATVGPFENLWAYDKRRFSRDADVFACDHVLWRIKQYIDRELY